MTDIEPIKDGEIIEYLSEQNKALTDDVIRLSKEANELRESKIRLINSLKRMQSDLSDLSDMARKISGDINVYRRAISHDQGGGGGVAGIRLWLLVAGLPWWNDWQSDENA